VQPIIHCHLRFGAALVVDSSYLIIWAPISLLFVIARSYRIRLNSEETHQDYYMHMETTKDPFSAMCYLFHYPTVSRIKASPSIETSSRSPLEPHGVDDTRSEFQKALLAAAHKALDV
jgi:hypothetical protein